EFQELLYQTTRSPGSEQGAGNQVPTGVQVGEGSRPLSAAKIFTTGALSQTGERLDVAISGDGFFEVQLPDGSRAYTRDGALKTASDGRRSTRRGFCVHR